ncbi:hypothetical protein [Bradyrhizobium ottawaense]|uniref:ParB/Sulfiredoxin domain-containing protein n=1 Tax=Bradyrhizobium ottawaense TaxID=931866 RepID=A0ABY0QH21_9BRAD|nr:hypothetical protein [Bradyrhizobium ottawaense]SDK39308.1 hypothetical protein SAMN05444163_8007 [Bradyrhizobium ottawaense]
MAFGYKVTVKPPHEREQIIQAQLTSPLREVTSHDVFENTPTSLKVIRIPLNLPIYRMANGRTATQQLAYVSEKGLHADYFAKGEENEAVQQIQHEILKKFAKDGTEQITPIIDVLKRDQQREPIWITPRGLVINGNRRLAAMRELYTESPTDYAEFAHVECAVLPALTAEQIVEIEIRLQMTPETKLPYGWIDECLMIQTQINCGKSESQIAHVMRSRPKEVKAAISALKEVNIYLSDWRKAPGDYRLVEESKQFFYDLPGRLKGKTGELLEASRRIGWVLIDNSSELGQRVYAFNDMFGNKAEEVLSKLADHIDIDLDEEGESDDDDADIDIDLGDEAGNSTTYGGLIGAIDDPARREEITDGLVVVCQTIIDASRTAKQGKNALAAVRDANTRLTEVDLTKAEPSTYPGIAKQLDEIVLRGQDLKTKLQAYVQGAKSKEAAS